MTWGLSVAHVDALGARAGVMAWNAILCALLKRHVARYRPLMRGLVRVLGLVLIGLGLWSATQLTVSRLSSLVPRLAHQLVPALC